MRFFENRTTNNEGFHKLLKFFGAEIDCFLTMYNTYGRYPKNFTKHKKGFKKITDFGKKIWCNEKIPHTGYTNSLNRCR